VFESDAYFVSNPLTSEEKIPPPFGKFSTCTSDQHYPSVIGSTVPSLHTNTPNLISRELT
jgi:hypothetical protein